MSLSSSLFTGTSGLTNMGNAMQVIGNNIANVNTVGFKKGRATFADTLSQSVATQAGTAQVGRGMALGSVDQIFDQGSFESTGNTTDLSIGGDGFFVLRQSGTQTSFYTRSGNFFFDKDGQLVNPEGYIVQGWELDGDTGDDIGSIKDIVLSAFTSPPKASTQITAITNLDADVESKTVVLSNLWDSSQDTYMEPTGFEYQTVVKVYDSLGTTHDVTIYYDKIEGSKWEYVITCDPNEDNRNLVQNTDSKGLLARGTITFSQGSGDIVNFTMSEFTGRIGNVQASGVNTPDDVNFTIKNYDAMPNDGYGFNLEFNGKTWDFKDIDQSGTVEPDEKPAGYPNAIISYSDDQHIEIVLAPTSPSDKEADIKIKLAQVAVATDNISFDINDKDALHVQGITGTTYTGETENDNTTLQINDPSVLTDDVNDVRLIWNPVTQEWHWSNPAGAATAGTLISDVSTNAAFTLIATDVATVINAGKMPMVSDSVDAVFDGATWVWNMPLKLADFDSQVFTFTPTNNPALSITTQGTDGVVPSAGTILNWNGTGWDNEGVVTGAGSASAMMVLTSGNDSTKVSMAIWDDRLGVTTGASVIQYTFGSPITAVGGQTISFDIVPSSPSEYPNAVITTTAGPQVFGVDFDGDAVTDVLFDASTSGVWAAGNTFTFTVNPDVPPEAYANAVLAGDQDKVYIDVDGSGNDSDREDIVFTFTDSLKYGETTDPYDDRSEIAFNIKGSTAWREITTDDVRRTGYYGFTADFLGGIEGSTEMNIEFNIGTRYDGLNFVNDSLTTTQYSRSSTTTFQNGDGYGAGDLQGVDVGSDGVITGIYSNGQIIPLYRVGLAKFFNTQGLKNVGGNLFLETRDSGDAITNRPGENGLGTISPNSLEMSNVDISEEFVRMITTQRGFQANSKTITTVDDMMSTVIQMKR
ncbi:MAG: flagellar hook-basal body complex protein [Pseudomonadota bacterium]